MSTMFKQNKSLTLRERLEIIKRNDLGEPVKSLVAAFGVGKTQIYELLRRKEELKKFAEDTPLSTKRMGRPDREFCEKLVAVVHKRPLLYDRTHEDYRDRFKVEAEWKIVAEIMDVPVEVIQRKWHNLTEMYLKSLRVSQSSGSQPKFYLYDQLSFLEDCMTQAPSTNFFVTASTDTLDIVKQETDSLDRPDNENPALPSTSFTTSPSVHSPYSNSNKRKRDSSFIDQDLSNCIEFKLENQIDPTLEFLKGLVPEINQLSRKRRRTFFKGVTTLLFQLLDEEDEQAEESRQCVNA